MVPENPVYRKRNSFIDIRYNQSVQNIIPRIEKLRGSLDSLTLTPYKRNIIKRAITDILGSDQAVKNGFLFVLHSFNISEIEKLEDLELPRFLFYRYRYEVFPQQLKLDEFPPFYIF